MVKHIRILNLAMNPPNFAKEGEWLKRSKMFSSACLELFRKALSYVLACSGRYTNKNESEKLARYSDAGRKPLILSSVPAI